MAPTAPYSQIRPIVEVHYSQELWRNDPETWYALDDSVVETEHSGTWNYFPTPHSRWRIYAARIIHGIVQVLTIEVIERPEFILKTSDPEWAIFKSLLDLQPLAWPETQDLDLAFGSNREMFDKRKRYYMRLHRPGFTLTPYGGGEEIAKPLRKFADIAVMHPGDLDPAVFDLALEWWVRPLSNLKQATVQDSLERLDRTEIWVRSASKEMLRVAEGMLNADANQSK